MIGELARFLAAERGVLLVAGLPGHGKTTLSRRLAELTGAARVSLDELRMSGRGGIDFYRRAGAEAAELRPSPVVVDACALTPDYRAALIGAVPGALWCAWFRPNVELAQPRRRHIDFERLTAILVEPTTAEGFSRVLLLDGSGAPE